MIRIVLLVAILLLLSNVYVSESKASVRSRDCCEWPEKDNHGKKWLGAYWIRKPAGTYIPAGAFKGCQQLTRMYVIIILVSLI